MKWANSSVLDNGLNQIKNNAVKMHILKAYALADTYSTVNTNTIASVTVASTDFTLSSSGSNRQLAGPSGKSATATGSSTQYDTGTATAGSTTTLTDSGKAWTTNAHAGRALTIVSGTGAGQVSVIVSNTATVATVSPAFGTAPDATSVYRISDDLHIAFTDGSANVYWVTDETSNQAVTSGNTVNFPQVNYTANQPT